MVISRKVDGSKHAKNVNEEASGQRTMPVGISSAVRAFK